MDKGDWWAAVHGVTKSQTSLSDGATQMNESGKIVFVDIWCIMTLSGSVLDYKLRTTSGSYVQS